MFIIDWDYGGCGPLGDDYNWEWCDRNRGGACKKEVQTNRCPNGKAKLHSVQGDQYARSYSHQYRKNGCWYTYFAYYIC